MTYEETLKITVDVLKKHVDSPREIKPADHIQSDLGLDSLGVMEVVADLEDALDVQIPTEALNDVSTVEGVAKALATLKR